MPLTGLTSLTSDIYADHRACAALIFQSLAAARSFIARYRFGRFCHVMPDPSVREDSKTESQSDRTWRFASYPEWRALTIPWYIESGVTSVSVTIVGDVTGTIQLALTTSSAPPTADQAVTASDYETTVSVNIPSQLRNTVIPLHLWCLSTVDTSASVHDGKIITVKDDPDFWEFAPAGAAPVSTFVQTVTDGSTPGSEAVGEPSPALSDVAEAMVIQLYNDSGRADANRLSMVGYRLVYTNSGDSEGWFLVTPGYECVPSSAWTTAGTLVADTAYWYSMFPIGKIEAESLLIESFGTNSAPTADVYLPGNVISARGLQTITADCNAIESANRRIHSVFPTSPDNANQVGKVITVVNPDTADPNEYTTVSILELEEETDVADYGIWIMIEPFAAYSTLRSEEFGVRLTAWEISAGHATQYDQVEYVHELPLATRKTISPFTAGAGNSFIEGRLSSTELQNMIMLSYPLSGLDFSGATWPLHLQIEVKSTKSSSAAYVHGVLVRGGVD